MESKIIVWKITTSLKLELLSHLFIILKAKIKGLEMCRTGREGTVKII